MPVPVPFLRHCLLLFDCKRARHLPSNASLLVLFLFTFGNKLNRTMAKRECAVNGVDGDDFVIFVVIAVTCTESMSTGFRSALGRIDKPNSFGNLWTLGGICPYLDLECIRAA